MGISIDFIHRDTDFFQYFTTQARLRPGLCMGRNKLHLPAPQGLAVDYDIYAVYARAHLVAGIEP